MVEWHQIHFLYDPPILPRLLLFSEKVGSRRDLHYSQQFLDSVSQHPGGILQSTFVQNRALAGSRRVLVQSLITPPTGVIIVTLSLSVHYCHQTQAPAIGKSHHWLSLVDSGAPDGPVSIRPLCMSPSGQGSDRQVVTIFPLHSVLLF